MDNRNLALRFVNLNCERLRLQAVIGQEMTNVVGSLLRLQQDLVIEVGSGAIAQTLCLGSLLPQNTNDCLFGLQIISEHLAAVKSLGSGVKQQSVANC